MTHQPFSSTRRQKKLLFSDFFLLKKFDMFRFMVVATNISQHTAEEQRECAQKVPLSQFIETHQHLVRLVRSAS